VCYPDNHNKQQLGLVSKRFKVVFGPVRIRMTSYFVKKRERERSDGDGSGREELLTPPLLSSMYNIYISLALVLI
jgi:hypothetical protein